MLGHSEDFELYSKEQGSADPASPPRQKGFLLSLPKSWPLPGRLVQLPGPGSCPPVPALLTCCQLPWALSRQTAGCICQGEARQRKWLFFMAR